MSKIGKIFSHDEYKNEGRCFVFYFCELLRDFGGLKKGERVDIVTFDVIDGEFYFEKYG